MKMVRDDSLLKKYQLLCNVIEWNSLNFCIVLIFFERNFWIEFDSFSSFKFSNNLRE